MARTIDARPLKKRILQNIFKDSNNCWNWQLSTSPTGYGQISTGSRTDKTRKTSLAHRVSYEIFTRKIEQGLQIDHLCRNRTCVNPEHLEQVTPKVNNHRGNPSWKQEAARTSCPQGHAYTESNTIISKKKYSRNCRKCAYARNLKRYHANKELQNV